MQGRTPNASRTRRIESQQESQQDFRIELTYANGLSTFRVDGVTYSRRVKNGVEALTNFQVALAILQQDLEGTL